MDYEIIKYRVGELIDFDLSTLASNKGEEITLQYVDISYVIALHWFIKLEWNSRHKIPFSRNITSLYKTKGIVLCNLFRLIERCFSGMSLFYSKQIDCNISNPAEWFSAVIFESMLSDLDTMRSPKNEIYKGRGKESTYALERALIKQIANIDDPNIPSRYELTRLLYSECYKLANQYDLFRKNYWNPYIKSLRNDLNFRNNGKEWTIAYTCGDYMTKQNGKGKGIITIKELLWSIENKSDFQKPYPVRTSGFIT